MRIDVWLHKVCVLKSRTMAKEACDRGKVVLRGEPAKPSDEVRVGDTVRLDLGVRALTLRVLAVPARNVARKDAGRFVEIVEERREEF